MSNNPIVMAIIEKERANSPVLKLLLEDIRDNMDVQIEVARAELEETRQLKAYVDSKSGNSGDKWSEYETMPRKIAYDRLYRTNHKIENQYDRIAAEG